MIASNYIKHPEALRFQCEMFSNGYHNSPRIMRLMECIFSHAAAVPQWIKDMKRKAAQLVKQWKAAQVEINLKDTPARAKKTPGFFYGPRGETWSGRGLMPRWLSTLVKNGDSKSAYLYSGR